MHALGCSTWPSGFRRISTRRCGAARPTRTSRPRASSRQPSRRARNPPFGHCAGGRPRIGPWRAVDRAMPRVTARGLLTNVSGRRIAWQRPAAFRRSSSDGPRRTFTAALGRGIRDGAYWNRPRRWRQLGDVVVLEAFDGNPPSRGRWHQHRRDHRSALLCRSEPAELRPIWLIVRDGERQRAGGALAV